MNWRRLFGASSAPAPTPAARSEKATEIADFITQKMEALTLYIVSTSWESTLAATPYIRRTNSLTHPQEAAIHLTFVLFFMRFMSMQALVSGLSREEFLRLRDSILPGIVVSQVEHFFSGITNPSMARDRLYETLSSENPLDESLDTYDHALYALSLESAKEIMILAGYEKGNDQPGPDEDAIINTLHNQFNAITSAE